MALFGGRRRAEARASTPSDSLPELLRRRLAPSSTGVPVDSYSAMTHGAVYQCVDLISDLVSGFPIERIRSVGRSRYQVTTKSVIDSPSTDVDPINWRRLLVIGWLLRGYTPALVTGVRDGYPTGLELIHPDRVMVQRQRPDSPLDWYLDGHKVELFPNGRLWVANGKMLSPWDGVGRSILEFAKEEAAVGLAARKYASIFFRDNAHPTGLLMNEKPVDQDGAKRVKERFLDAMRDTREPAVFGDGWKYQAIQIKPDESQFLETIRANRSMVAGFFRVPPEIIGAPSATGMTYVNVENRGIDLLRFTISSWVYRMESVLQGLVPKAEKVKLNTDNLLRTDLNGRYRAYDQGIRAGFLSVNDVREHEDLDPIEGGDQYLWPPYRQQLTYDELAQDPDYPDWTDEGLSPNRPESITPAPPAQPAQPAKPAQPARPVGIEE